MRVAFLSFLFFITPFSQAFAVVDGAPIDTGTVRGTVIKILSEDVRPIPATGAKSVVQDIEARIDDGEVVQITNDRVLLHVGDAFYATWQETANGKMYTINEADRRGVILFSVFLFICATILIGGWVGFRALLSLAVSVFVIVYMLLPQLAHGAPPIVTSTIFASIILAVAMGVTHGLHRTTMAAFGASVITILFAILLGNFFVIAARLSGFTDDVSTILNLSTGGTLHMDGLLLGALIIGILGIIDDLAVTQVLTVQELKSANELLSKKELYVRAMRVGKEHLGAVVNTLVLAYAGTALPLLLLFSLSPSDPMMLLNSEVMAVEIIRSTVGGVALALILPIATWFGIIVIKNGSTEPLKKHHAH